MGEFGGGGEGLFLFTYFAYLPFAAPHACQLEKTGLDILKIWEYALLTARWALAVTRFGAEESVAAGLAQNSFAHHLFMVRKIMVVRGSVRSRLCPAFPSYVFVDPEDRWRSVLEIPGVIDFVRFSERAQPEMLNDRVVEGVAARTTRDIFPGEIPLGDFKHGDRVNVFNSVACGCHGIYQHSIGYPQAIILVDWMGRMVPLNIDERDLEIKESVPSRMQNRKRGRRRRRGKHSADRIAGKLN